MHDDSNVRPGVVSDDAEGSTVLDHIRPTVVVRRRVYEVTVEPRRRPAPAARVDVAPTPGFAPDDEAPPSSFVPSPLDAYAAGEDDDDDFADDDDDLLPPSSRVPTAMEAAPLSLRPLALTAQKSIAVPPTIAVAELASAVGQRAADIAAELVACGFFEVTARATIPRAAASLVAARYGFVVDAVDGPAAPEPRATRTPRTKTARRTATAKRASAAAKAPPPRAPRRKNATKRAA